MTFQSSISTLQRAIGNVEIAVRVDEFGITKLTDLRQEGSMRTVFPKSTNHNLEAVIVNTAGGITSGDKFTILAEVADGAKLSLTTQAAERIYCASGSDIGNIKNKLSVGENAQLFWVPQETILFDGSRLQRQLNVEISNTSKFLFVEPLVFGRIASGEELVSCYFKDSVSITCNGQPIYIDRIKIDGDINELLKKKSIGNNNKAMANIVLYDTNSIKILDNIRMLLPLSAGASLINDHLLVIRILTSDSYELRKILFPILSLLTDNTVPKNWKL
jgi:urease accessory protein